MGVRRNLRAISATLLVGALVLIPASPSAADDVRDAQWPLRTLKAESLWSESRGAGQVVAVIDDGVKADHPDLKGSILTGKDFVDGGDPDPEAGDSHGTGIASVIAGHGHGPDGADGVMGLAPEAKILPIRDQGYGNDGYAESIRYAVDHGATVINISQKQDRALAPHKESEAIAYALQRGIPVVAGTGNDGGEVGYPAAYDGVVAVSGTNEQGSFWSGSNRGEQTLLSAPAVDVVNAASPEDLNGYGIGTGTSASTAYVSASVALLKAKFPDLTAGQIVNRLTETARLPASAEGGEVPDEQYGYGVIRPLEALRADVPKGSEYGPLSVPRATKDKQRAEEKRAEGARLQKQADRKAFIAWSVIGVMGLLLIALIVFLVVRRRRKRNRSGWPGGGPGGTGGPAHPYPMPGQAQAPPYGAAGPYGAPPQPQHGPYGTPPPQGYPATPPQQPPQR
ncbi:S8 family serine peptidase [Streptomyces sp. TR06-5]|uniref:S8 family serine peptidase n=1 Tax=Streptomyces sp. TR06-5 TaxID=3385976 RepID=UPI0039A3A6A6